MRLDYTSMRLPLLRLLIAGLLLAGLAACAAPQARQGDIHVTLYADGETIPLQLPAGSRVQTALDAAQIVLDENDLVSPDGLTVLDEGAQIYVTRVDESFSTEIVTIPFERQIIQSESLPAGEQRLVQAGENGQREYTYRHVYKNGVEEGQPSIIKSVLLKEPVPEIMMVGIQNAFVPVAIPGKIAYISSGNAWVMDGSTANRRPLVTSGDLDGRIFFLSPGGEWLIFSRQSDAPAGEGINSLWAVSTTEPDAQPFYLKADNVVHFAAWWPGTKQTLVYSTVEPRSAAPGWQANNDLWQVSFGSGWATTPKIVLEAQSGGIYGWWGSDYIWSENGDLAYLRPDEIGLVDTDKWRQRPLVHIAPYQTRSDWAWLPGAAFSPDGQVLYFIAHDTDQALSNPEESPYFNLEAVYIATGARVRLAENSGMFAYPTLSPTPPEGSPSGPWLAYLQAIFPTQSENSRYRLMLMDRDGSEKHLLFPPENQPGLTPQRAAWAPYPTENAAWYIAVIYEGNIWLVDAISGEAHQVTGDGLASRLDWR